LTKNLYEFEKYNSRRILAEFFKVNSKREKLDTLLKRLEKQEAPNMSMRAADWSMHVLKRTWSLWMNR